MADASLNDPALVAKPLGRQAQVVTEGRQVSTAEIPQLHPLQVVPDTLVWMQIRRVAGQLLQMDASGTPAGQEVLNGLPPVNGRAIPDHQQRTGDVPQQVPEEAHNILTAQGPLLDQQQELAIRSNPTDGREVIVGQRDPQERGLS